MARADRDRQAVDARSFREIDGLLRIGQKFLDVFLVFLGIQADDVFLNAAQHPQLRFDDHARLVSQLHGLGEVHVLIVRMMAAIDHDRRVTIIHTRLN